MKIFSTLIIFLLTVNLMAVTVGEKQVEISISEDDGGLAKDGSKWSSKTIKDKVYVLFYVDPDEREVNEHFQAILKAQKYDHANFGTIAVINLAATWKPNVIIESLLKSKQEEFPDTIYVKDKNSVLVNKWKLHDDSSEILLFSKDSKLLFYHSGKMSDENIKDILKLINENI